MSYHQILWIVEAVWVDIILIVSVCNLTGSIAAKVPVNFQSNWQSLNPNLTDSRLHEILR